MKDIKFRAWVKDWCEMVEVDGINFKQHAYASNPEIIDQRNDCHAMKDISLMQYTGQKDKNGIEIYEGDILKVKLHNGGYENYLVEWDENDSCFEAYNKDKSNYIFAYVWQNCEVIGNIYENPELMGRSLE